MNKLLTTSLLVAGTVVLVSAQERDIRPEPIRAAVNIVRPMLASGTPMGDFGVPFTGDKAIDDQIKALVKDRDAKIKAIQEEFQTKLKALIGERKTLRASTTEQFREEMRDKIRTASGTPVLPPRASSTPRMMEDGAKRPQQAPTNFIRRFFQSFFGGNPNEAQAESN